MNVSKILAILAVAGAAVVVSGCAQTSGCCGEKVVYAQPRPEPADAVLKACADHTANAARASGQDFKRMRLDTAGRYKAPLEQYVGDTYVATVQDGYGEWHGRKEWRAIRFHCLSDAAGQVVYSFVRAE